MASKKISELPLNVTNLPDDAVFVVNVDGTTYGSPLSTIAFKQYTNSNFLSLSGGTVYGNLYLSGNSLYVKNLNSSGIILSGGKNLFDIFASTDKDSQTLVFISSSYEINISNGNTISLSSIKIYNDTSFLAISGGIVYGNVYLSGNRLYTKSIDSSGPILSSGKDLFDIFLTHETDSQTLNYNANSYDLSISNGNVVSLSSIKIYNDNSFLAISGGIVTGNVYLSGNAYFNDTNTTGKLLSGGKDLFSIFLTSETDSQTLNYNENSYNLGISNGNVVSLSSIKTYNDNNFLAISGGVITGNVYLSGNTYFNNTDTKGVILSSGKDLFDIFLTSETDSQTLNYNENSYNLSISNGNTISLSSIKTYNDNNFLAISGGIVTGNVYVSGNTYFNNTDTKGVILSGGVNLFDIFLTSETDSQTLNYNENLYNISISNGNTISLSSIKIYNDNNFLALSGGTVTGNVYVSGNALYSKEINATNLLLSAGKNLFDIFLTSETDSQTLNYVGSSFDLTISNGNTISLLPIKNYVHSGFLPLSGGIIKGNVSLDGSLFISGTAATVNSVDLVVSNPIVYLASDNPSNVFDIGFVGTITVPPIGEQYIGLVRIADENKWSLFSGLTSSPASGIDINDPAFTIDTLKANIEGNITSSIINSDKIFSNDLITKTISSQGTILSGGKDLFDIFLTSETDSQTLNYTPNSYDLSISNGNTVSLLPIKQYNDSNFLAISGGTVNGNISSSQTIYDSFGNSIQWNSVYSTVGLNSAINWSYQGNDVKALTGFWESVYTNVNLNSSVNWNYQGTDIKSLTGFWDSVYATTNLNSAINWSYQGNDVKALTGFWESSYTTVNLNSAVNWNYQGTDIKLLTGVWDSTYTTVNQNSAVNWNYQGTDIKALTGAWSSVYSTVNSNSAVNWNYQGTDIKSLTGFWDSTYTTVNQNSASWSDTTDTGVRSLTSNWQSTYLNQTNYLPLSGGVLSDGLSVVGNISANGNIYSMGKILSAGVDLLNIFSGGGGGYTFPSDLTVSLSNNKTFGKYTNGQVIPSTGKTAAQVIQMAIAESINPTVSLTTSTTVAFNQTAINNVLNLSYTINTLGASVASAVLEWRRNNAGSWTTLSTSTTNPTSYTHSITDTAYNTQPFNYRYTVTDNTGATATATVNITPAAYSPPSISLSVAGASTTSPESNLIRERGNVSSNTSGSITRNSPNVALVNYVIQYQVDGGSWTDIGVPTSISGSSYVISSSNHNPSGSTTAATIAYRIKVLDAYQQYLSSQVYSSTSTITFKYLIFYGSSSTTPTNSSSVRSLANKAFFDVANPIILNTGTTNTKFTIAMPSTLTVTNVIDLDALNADITSNYVNNPFSVNDYASQAVSYNVYTCSNGVPYSSNHRHQITKS